MSTTHPYPTRWRALGVIATAQFLVIMDTSIIGVALPDMQESLGFSPSTAASHDHLRPVAAGTRS